MSYTEATHEQIVNAVKQYLISIVQLRVSLGIVASRDLDRIIVLDEMSMPMESHPTRVLRLMGIPKAWISTHGFQNVKFTALFAFTLAGRKLGIVFVFKGRAGKRLEEQSKNWLTEMQRKCLTVQGMRAYFFFSPKGFMNSFLYAKALRHFSEEFNQEYEPIGEDSGSLQQAPEFIVGRVPRILDHDRAPAHEEIHIESLMREVGFVRHVITSNPHNSGIDVTVARHIRAGYLTAQAQHWHHNRHEEMQSLPKMRLLCVTLLLRAWYGLTPASLLRQAGIDTGTSPAVDGSQDSHVRIFVDQDKVEYPGLRKYALEHPIDKPPSRILSASEELIQQRADRVQEEIKAAYIKRQAKKEGRQSDKKKVKSKKRKKTKKNEKKQSRLLDDIDESDTELELEDKLVSVSESMPLEFALLFSPPVFIDKKLVGHHILYFWSDGWNHGVLKKYLPKGDPKLSVANFLVQYAIDTEPPSPKLQCAGNTYPQALELNGPNSYYFEEGSKPKFGSWILLHKRKEC